MKRHAILHCFFPVLMLLIVVGIVPRTVASDRDYYLEARYSANAKTTINAIWQASQIFYQDKGRWPISVHQLEQEKFLEIASLTRKQWAFSVIGTPLTTIIAVSTEEMKGGAGHQLSYDVSAGTWSGYGLPDSEDASSNERYQVDRERVSDALTTINAIWQASQVFYQDKGRWPISVHQLEQEKYLEIASLTRKQWAFSVIGTPLTTIIAVSTEEMKGGAGHQLSYDVSAGTWSGYGLPDSEDASSNERYQVDRERVSDALTTIDAIWLWSQTFYQLKGRWPSSVKELEVVEFLKLGRETAKRWIFAIVGNPPVAITAVSTEAMPGGAGNQVQYNIQDGSWSGYGIPEK